MRWKGEGDVEIKGIIRIGHVVLKVRDLEKARQFYCGVLGMKLGNYDPERGMFLRFNDYHHDIAIFRTGADADPPKENQVGLVHVALLVDSLETVKAWYERFKALGVPIVGTTDHAITNSVYFKDPEGNVLEIYCEVSEYDWRTRGMGFIAKPLDFETMPTGR
jgi:catechol 2,3-dioxygenase